MIFTFLFHPKTDEPLCFYDIENQIFEFGLREPATAFQSDDAIIVYKAIQKIGITPKMINYAPLVL